MFFNWKSSAKLSLIFFYLISFLGISIALISMGYFFTDGVHFPFVEQSVVYLANKNFLYTHIVGGILAIILGLFQCVKSRNVKVHIVIGICYYISVIISSLSGLFLSKTAFGFLNTKIAFTILSIIWLLTSSIALFYAIKKNYVLHGVWILRSVALSLSAVSLRVGLGLYLFVFKMSFPDAYALSAWTCWVFNIIFLEWIILPLYQSSKMNSYGQFKIQNFKEMI